MLTKLWFLLTLLLAALLLGTTFAHTLEMQAKLQYNASQWTRLQHTLYGAFARIGGRIELGALVASAVLAFMLRHHRLSFALAAAAVVCLAIAFGIWMFITNAVNAETAKWSAQSIPADWGQWRLRWEYSHAARFVLHLVGFSALIVALLVTAPAATGQTV